MHPSHVKNIATTLLKVAAIALYYRSHADAGLAQASLFGELFESTLMGSWAWMGHFLAPDKVARSIGWPASRFQIEIAFMNAGVATASLLGCCGGMLAQPEPRWDLVMAAVLVKAVVYLGCGHAHFVSLREDDNWAFSNVSFSLLMLDDVLVCVWALSLWLCCAPTRDPVGFPLGVALLVWGLWLCVCWFVEVFPHRHKIHEPNDPNKEL
ncbi:hypothetical protein TeGR_g6615 [Tetraparma gracilis]|uniref:Uncharacterized protein n=1 Tax=Tetraparma gracilis TaxID=2962635 RepID=A0ABQ6MLH4_9STRA|nr:hypothetical protein TeGR_g6615 [Tetraparma gracilis]